MEVTMRPYLIAISITAGMVYGLSYYFEASYISALITLLGLWLLLGVAGAGEGEESEDADVSFSLKPYQALLILFVVIVGLIALSANVPAINELSAR
jgi:hypothetical protein